MLQIALAIWGIIILFTGKLTVSRDKVVLGTPARLLGLIMIAPFPLAFVIGMGVGLWAAANQRNLNDLMMPLQLMEVGLVIGAAILAYSVAHFIGKPPGQPGLVQAFAGPYPPATPGPPADPNNPYHPPRM